MFGFRLLDRFRFGFGSLLDFGLRGFFRLFGFRLLDRFCFGFGSLFNLGLCFRFGFRGCFHLLVGSFFGLFIGWFGNFFDFLFDQFPVQINVGAGGDFADT